MSQYLIDCKADTCTMVPYSTPPATVDHYLLGPGWMYLLIAVIVLAFIIATAIVRYKRHEERGETERQRILHPPKQCPTCGDIVGAS